jgi:hypothetical protein
MSSFQAALILARAILWLVRVKSMVIRDMRRGFARSANSKNGVRRPNFITMNDVL